VIANTRKAVASYLSTSRASHRAIARLAGVSASSVDRACRSWRAASHRDCPHGRPDARSASQPDARPSETATVRQGNVIPMTRQRVDDAPSPGVAVTRDAPDALVVTQPERADAPATESWSCDYCGAGLQTTDRCEQCGWPKAVPR
jgi:hypothetical protein